MLQVKVYPDISSNHMSQIYAGLYELQASGKINLKFTRRCPSSVRHYNRHTLWIEAEDLKNGSTRKLCFDMGDYCAINSIHRLKECDLYFKRSYHRSSIDKLPINLRAKIFPYGLNYACRSQYEKSMLRRSFIYHIVNKSLFKSPFVSLKDISKQYAKALISRYGLNVHIQPPLIRDFELKPDEPAKEQILFLTRVYSPDEAPGVPPGQLKDLNEMRSNIIRVLKKSFGDYFIGGIARSEFAKKYYPDCITSEDTGKKNFMNLVKRCLIAVTTTGLYNSTGWKLAEYMAASRCIVSERPIYDLPVPLQEGRHYMPFSTPDECVKACEELFNDQDLAIRMRRNNHDYYSNEIHPSALLFRCLKTSLETCS